MRELGIEGTRSILRELGIEETRRYIEGTKRDIGELGIEGTRRYIEGTRFFSLSQRTWSNSSSSESYPTPRHKSTDHCPGGAKKPILWKSNR